MAIESEKEMMWIDSKELNDGHDCSSLLYSTLPDTTFR